MGAFGEEAMGEGGSGISEEDGLGCLSENFSFVDFGGEFEKGNTGFLITEGKGVLNRSGATILREKGGMDVDDTVGEEIK